MEALLKLIVILWYLINPWPTTTGNTLSTPTDATIAYVEYAPDHGGNFVGDIYLLDAASGEITQMTNNGEMGIVGWLSHSATLVVYHRPQGSVVNPYTLNVTTGDLTPMDTHLFNELNTTLSLYGNAVRSPYGEWVTVQLNQSWTDYAVISLTGETAQQITTISSISPPVWLIQDKETLLYNTDGGEICLLHVPTNSGNCIDGGGPATVSFINSADRVAFTRETDMGTYTVCVSPVVEHRFAPPQCFGESDTLMTSLNWYR